jgi:hypothetical protein
VRAKFWFKAQRKRTLKEPSHRWEDDIKSDLKEIGLGGEVT